MRGGVRPRTLAAVETPLITVFGATSTLGAALTRALLRPPQRRFRVRAVTRAPGGRVAQALAALGAEPIVADLEDADSVRRALQGAHGAFCRTLAGPTEAFQARAMRQAVLDAGVAHVVWWLPASPHALVGLPVDRLVLGFAWEALMGPGLMPHRDAQRRLVLDWPRGVKHLAGISAEDAGACVAALCARGWAPQSAPIALAGDALDASALVSALARSLEEPVLLRLQAVAALPLAWSEGLRRAAGADGPGAVGRARRLYPGLRGFERWMRDHRTKWQELTRVGCWR